MSLGKLKVKGEGEIVIYLPYIALITKVTDVETGVEHAKLHVNLESGLRYYITEDTYETVQQTFQRFLVLDLTAPASEPETEREDNDNSAPVPEQESLAETDVNPIEPTLPEGATPAYLKEETGVEEAFKESAVVEVVGKKVK
jgi:hypothetical protein